ncbi:hypothetical protein ES707_22391 [subsurface metagenome]
MITILTRRVFASKFSVYRSAALTLGTGGFVEVVFDAVLFDGRNEYSVANGRFTAVETGYYLLAFRVGIQDLADGKYIMVSLWLNGGPPYLASSRTVVGGVNWVVQGANKVVHMQAGEYASVFVYHDHGDDRLVINTEECTYLSGHRLS